MAPRTPRPFVTAGEALQTALGALKAAKPILDDLRPAPSQAPNPELAKVCRLVDDAISTAEAS